MDENQNLKAIDSPVKRWPGKVYLPPYMPFEQLLAWEEAMQGLQGNANNLRAVAAIALPLVCDLVVRWEIEGLPEKVTPQTFPGTAELVMWLVQAGTLLMRETNDLDPNLLAPPSSA